jgi:hypothetical protein
MSAAEQPFVSAPTHCLVCRRSDRLTRVKLVEGEAALCLKHAYRFALHAQGEVHSLDGFFGLPGFDRRRSSR